MDWAISDSLSWFPTAGSPLHTVWGMGNWRQKGKEASLRSEASLALSARPSFPPGRTPAGVRAGAFSFSGAADSRTWTRTARFTPANGAGGSKPSPTAGVIAATVGAKPARQRTGNVSLPCPRRYAAVPRSWACRVRMPIAGCRRSAGAYTSVTLPAVRQRHLPKRGTLFFALRTPQRLDCYGSPDWPRKRSASPPSST